MEKKIELLMQIAVLKSERDKLLAAVKPFVGLANVLPMAYRTEIQRQEIYSFNDAAITFSDCFQLADIFNEIIQTKE